MRAVVFNPLPWSRRYPLNLPPVYHSGWEQARLEYHLEIASPQGNVSASVDYGVIDLPPFGYVTVPVRYSSAEPSSLNPQLPCLTPSIAPGLAATSGVRSHGWIIENQRYVVKVDSLTGAIRSLVSKSDGEEWVDCSTPWHMGQYVYEDLQTPRKRDDIQLDTAYPDYDYQPHLKPRHRGPAGVLDHQFIAGVGQGRFKLQLQAPGVRDLHVQIVLYDDLPWIDLIFDMDKLPVTDPESVYITFPLALAEPRVHYQAAGAVVRAEDQQLANACRDFYAVQHWIDVSSAARGLTVATPDSPLFHVGGFANHRHQTQLHLGQPLLIGWPLNNHWWTNFVARQDGWMRFRYRLLPHRTPFDAVSATRFGAEAAVEPLIGPVQDRPAGMQNRTALTPVHMPESAGLLTIDPDNVHLITLKPAHDGRGVIVRLQELTGKITGFRLRWLWGQISRVEACNLVEDEDPAAGDSLRLVDGQTIIGTLDPHRFQTFRLLLAES